MTAEITSGEKYEVRQKLVSAIHKRIEVTNEFQENIVIEVKEGIDGSKPSLVIRITKAAASSK